MRSWSGSGGVLERLNFAACQERASVDEKNLNRCSSFFNPDFSLTRDAGQGEIHVPLARVVSKIHAKFRHTFYRYLTLYHTRFTDVIDSVCTTLFETVLPSAPFQNRRS